MTSPRQTIQVDINYDVFQRMLGSIIAAHRDEYALMRDCEITGFFSSFGDAYRAGLARYPDGIFSLQEVTDKPAELGIYSLFPHEQLAES